MTVTVTVLYVITISFRKIKEKRSLFQRRTGNLLEFLFEVRPFLVAVFCRFLFQAELASFNEIHQNVKDLVE